MIPDALLERYLAGDLSPEQKTKLEAELAASPKEQARLDALRADSAAFLVQHPPGPLVAKAEATRKRSLNWLGFILAPLAAAAALLLFISRPHEEDLGIKGNVAFSIHRKTASGSERVEIGSPLKAGDNLRFEIRAPKDGWIAVLERDGAGHVTVVSPYGGSAAQRHAAQDTFLPDAVGLDETHGPEEFWVLFSEKPFTLERYVETLQKGASLAFSPDVSATRSSWPKE